MSSAHRNPTAAEDLAIPSDLADLLLHSPSPQVIASEALERARGLCQAGFAALVVAGASFQMDVIGRARDEQAALNNPTARLVLALAEAGRHASAPLLIERDGAGSSQAVRRLLRDEGFRLAVVAALGERPALDGVLVLLWRTSEVPEEALERAATLGRLLGLALANTLRYQAAEHERAQSAALIEHAGAALLTADPETLVVRDANRAAGTLSGYPTAELRGRPLDTLVSLGRDERQALLDARVRTRLQGILVRQDGSELPVAISTGLVSEPQPALLLSLQDLSEQWRPLQRLMLAERLAGMSRLTAVIAHEMNNPLQAIANSLRLLARPLEAEKRERYLAMAQAEIERLSGLVRRSLDVHRPAHEGRRAVAIHALLASAFEELEPLASRQGVVIEHELAAGNLRVVGVGAHLRELFLSLTQNAIEAMPEGGRLVVRTRVEIEPASSHDQIITIEFADTGPGIPEDRLQSIFEPFYTTKHDSAGMGLAICYSIVENHAGRLSVSSSEQGAVFRVSLPAASATSSF